MAEGVYAILGSEVTPGLGGTVLFTDTQPGPQGTVGWRFGKEKSRKQNAVQSTADVQKRHLRDGQGDPTAVDSPRRQFTNKNDCKLPDCKWWH